MFILREEESGKMPLLRVCERLARRKNVEEASCRWPGWLDVFILREEERGKMPLLRVCERLARIAFGPWIGFPHSKHWKNVEEASCLWPGWLDMFILRIAFTGLETQKKPALG